MTVLGIVSFTDQGNNSLLFLHTRYFITYIEAISADHTSHGSVSVVRTTFKVYGKMQTLTLSQPKTPEPIVTKF